LEKPGEQFGPALHIIDHEESFEVAESSHRFIEPSETLGIMDAYYLEIPPSRGGISR
jgi:hypothetical protein